MLKLFPPIVFAATIAVAAPALAEPDALPSTRVQAADLDLSSAAGRQTFHRRVHSASYLLCGHAPTTPLIEARQIQACKAAVARSAEQGMTTLLARSQDASLVRGTH